MAKIDRGDSKWSELFKKTDFFHRYKIYLEIVAQSEDQNEQRLW
jgi:poly(A) polymerase